jgi:hypothetical protein
MELFVAEAAYKKKAAGKKMWEEYREAEKTSLRHMDEENEKEKSARATFFRKRKLPHSLKAFPSDFLIESGLVPRARVSKPPVRLRRFSWTTPQQRFTWEGLERRGEVAARAVERRCLWAGFALMTGNA